MLEALLRKRRKNESIFRYIIGLSHLWIGLVTGLFICIISLSGAIYSLHSEFDAIENRSISTLDAPTESTASVDHVLKNYKADHGKNAWRIIVPSDSTKNISITERPIGFDRKMYFYHRATGEYIGQASNISEGIAVTMVQLHRWLMLPNQQMGTKIVGITSIIFIFLLLTGVVLWFPTNRKKLSNSFSLSLKGNFARKNWNLHINYGFYSTLFLLVIVVSGLCITYPSFRKFTLDQFKEEKVEKKEKTKRPIMKADYDYYKSLDDSLVFDRMFAVAQIKLGYKNDRLLYFPHNRLREYSIFSTDPSNFMSGQWSDLVTFNDKGKYKRTYYFNDLNRAQKLNNLISAIHKGEIFGVYTKVLYLLLALFACYLPISGVIIWWKRSKKKIMG